MLKNSSDPKSDTSRFIPCLSGFSGTSSIFRRIRNSSVGTSWIAQNHCLVRVYEGACVKPGAGFRAKGGPYASIPSLGFRDFGTFRNRGPLPALKMILGWVNTRHFLRILKRPEMCVRAIRGRGSAPISGLFGGICRIRRIPRNLLGFRRFHRK